MTGAGDSGGALVSGEGDGSSLPSLDSLVQRVPDEAKKALDQHLRGKFVAVRRVDPEKLR